MSKMSPWVFISWILFCVFLFFYSLGNFPGYIESTIVSLPAFIFLFFHPFFRTFAERGVQAKLILAFFFLLPLSNTFIMKAIRKVMLGSTPLLEVFRPELLLLVGLVFALRKTFKRHLFQQKFYLVFFVVSIGSLLISSIAASDPLYSIGYGSLGLLIPALVFPLSLALKSSFSKESILGFLELVLLNVYSILFFGIIKLVREGEVARVVGFPVLADDFLTIKMHLDIMKSYGDVTFGNTDNLVSLLVLVLGPAIYFTTKSVLMIGKIHAVGFVLVMLSMLICYSRSGLFVMSITLICLVFIFKITEKKWSFAAVFGLIFIMVIHFDMKILEYYSRSLQSFRIMEFSLEDRFDQKFLARYEFEKEYDYSSIARSEALKKGIELGLEHGVSGIGYGLYNRIETYFTSPHSLLLLRWVEGGILGAVSLFLLLIWNLKLFIGVFARKDIASSIFLISSLGFLCKGIVFGADFSIFGVTIWGCLFFLYLSLCLEDRDLLSDAKS